jgi:hypothetical protein
VREQEKNNKKNGTAAERESARVALFNVEYENKPGFIPARFAPSASLSLVVVV